MQEPEAISYIPAIPPATPAVGKTQVTGSTPEKPSSRRLSARMLDVTDEVTKAAANQTTEQRILSAEKAAEIFEAYKQWLQAENKTAIYSQFTMLRIETRPPDEVHIISPSELTETYVKEQRTGLLDFYRAATNMIIRITTEVQEDEDIKNAQINTVLSKSEMFEAMVQKNPNLARLKDGLGMSLEF